MSSSPTLTTAEIKAATLNAAAEGFAQHVHSRFTGTQVAAMLRTLADEVQELGARIEDVDHDEAEEVAK